MNAKAQDLMSESAQRVTADLREFYVHMTKFNGRWVIVNVLWHLKPKAKQD